LEKVLIREVAAKLKILQGGVEKKRKKTKSLCLCDSVICCTNDKLKYLGSDVKPNLCIIVAASHVSPTFNTHTLFQLSCLGDE